MKVGTCCKQACRKQKMLLPDFFQVKVLSKLVVAKKATSTESFTPDVQQVRLAC